MRRISKIKIEGILRGYFLEEFQWLVKKA